MSVVGCQSLEAGDYLFLVKHILEHYIIDMRTSALKSICRGVACVARRLRHIGRGTPRPYIVALFIIMGVCNTPLHCLELILDDTNSGQRRDGSQLWDIRFAIEGIADNDSLQIFITAFTQSGETLDCYSLIGDYPIIHGSGSFHIIWDIGADVPNREFYSDSIIIKLAAARAGTEPWNCGPYAYVADGLEGLRIIDVGIPFAPVEVGFYDTPDYAWGVFVSNGFAYVADEGSGLRIIDVGDPGAPIEVGFYNTPGSARDVFVVP